MNINFSELFTPREDPHYEVADDLLDL